MKKQTIAYVKEDCSGLTIANKEYFMSVLKDFGPGVKLKISIENYHPTRTLGQNGLLHWYMDLLAEEAGMEMGKFKARMADKYLRRPVLDAQGEYICDQETGEIEMYVPSTADLDTKEMGEYINKIRMFGIYYLNYELPEADKNYKINFQEEKKKQLKNKNQ